MTSFVVLTAVWKRSSLTELVLKSHQRNQAEIAGEAEVHFLAVGSEGDRSRALCRDRGFDYVEHPNAPLSYKWNAGVRAAEAYRPDAVVIVGSDAFLSANLLPTYAEKLSQGFDFFGFRDLYFYDPAGSRLGYGAGTNTARRKTERENPSGAVGVSAESCWTGWGGIFGPKSPG